MSSTLASPWPVSRDWSSKRIPVRIPGNQEILSPCNLTLELLSPTSQTLHTNLHLPTSLTSLVQGTLIVVLWKGIWERACILTTSLDTVKVRLLDRDGEVETVEYSQCRDLPRNATLVPPRFIQVSLVGVEQLEDWRQEHMEHMKCVLHMEECSPSRELYILVHSCRNPLLWRVVLLEVVANNHQVDLASLLLLEGLGTPSREGRRLILGLWEGREGDLGPWYKEGRQGDLGPSHKEEVKGCQDRLVEGQTMGCGRINRETEEYEIKEKIASVNGDVWKARMGKSNIESKIIPTNVKITRKNLIRWRNRPWQRDFVWDKEEGEIVVTNIESTLGWVWCVPVTRREIQSKLQTVLQCIVPSHYSHPHGENILEVGEAVVARWHEDNNWHRAQVETVHRDTVTVLFIDYGNTEMLPSDNVVAVSSIVYEDLDKLLSIPKLAIKTGLYQIKLDLERKEDLLSVMYRVQDFGQDWASPAWVKLCGVSNQGDPLVNVVWMEEGNEYSLHRELMVAGLAIRD